MPKERLHLLIADQCSRKMNKIGSAASLPEELRSAFLLGAISPDIFFYDFPSFRLDALGGALHRLEGTAGLTFFRRWIEEERNHLPAGIQAWLLGMASHFLTDALWHPLISEFSISRSGPCRKLKLSARFCHYWIESELEALWLARMGPSDGYIPLLIRFGEERESLSAYAAYYRKMISRAGIEAIPTESKLRHCFYWQNFSMRQFAHPAWIKRRSWLLARSFIRSFGTLVVPRESALPLLLSSELSESVTASTLCDEEFMEKTLTLLATRLSALPLRL